MLTSQEEKSFFAAFHVRRVDKCCGNCRHFDRQYEDSGCGNPKQVEFDSYSSEARKYDEDYQPHYGVYGGVCVDEGYVCDLWEGKPPKEDAK